jgi:glycosyltransferase involved in cell wall biosynthesis
MTERCVIGIPAHNEQASIAATIASVFEQVPAEGWRHDIVIVVNGSRDATTDVVLELATSRFGMPVRVERPQGVHWRFACGSDSVTVIDTPQPGKANAVNLVHEIALKHAASAVALVDADVRLTPTTIAQCCNALDRDSMVAAPRVCGAIARARTARGVARRTVCAALNEFDRCTPRVDGRCYVYTTSLLLSHPPILPLDAWIEGEVELHGSRCAYLQDVVVQYRFPTTWAELVAQYARYDATWHDFVEAFSSHPAAITRARRVADTRPSTPVWSRLVGRAFLEFVHRRAAKPTLKGDVTWAPAVSSKSPVAAAD